MMERGSFSIMRKKICLEKLFQLFVFREKRGRTSGWNHWPEMYLDQVSRAHELEKWSLYTLTSETS